MAKWYMLPFAIAALLRLRHTYDVIYCPDPRGVGIAAVLVRALLGRRVVFEVATPGSLSHAPTGIPHCAAGTFTRMGGWPLPSSGFRVTCMPR